MEFVNYGDAMELLGEVGVVTASEDDDRLELGLDESIDSVRLRVIPEGATDDDERPAFETVTVSKERLPELLEGLFHRMHMQQLLVLPIGKWRRVFDAVAFSMASVEDWAEVDAMSSVSLNTRDPLLCEPLDLHTLRALIGAILSDAETKDQGILIATPQNAMVVELHPDGVVNFVVSGNAVASEIAKTMAA